MSFPVTLPVQQNIGYDCSVGTDLWLSWFWTYHHHHQWGLYYIIHMQFCLVYYMGGGKPVGNWQVFPRVWVWAQIFWPSENSYPWLSVQVQVTSWLYDNSDPNTATSSNCHSALWQLSTTSDHIRMSTGLPMFFYLGCGPLHTWQLRVLFGVWGRHELIVFSHMHECIHTYIQYLGWEHVRLL